jgi:hypothetical protein
LDDEVRHERQAASVRRPEPALVPERRPSSARVSRPSPR